MLPVLLKRWGQDRGYQQMGDTLVNVQGKYIFSYSYNSGYNMGYANDMAYYVSVPVDAQITKEIRKGIAGEVRRWGKLIYRNSVIYVQMKGSSFRPQKILERMEAVTDTLAEALPRRGLAPFERCFYCDGAGCDDKVERVGVCYHTHSTCKAEHAQKIYQQIVDNQKNGNYLIATLVALLGGIVGSLPSLGTAYFGEFIVGWLFVLIPLLALVGYEKARGIMSRGAPVIISGISLLCTLIAVAAMNYILLAKDFGELVGLGPFFELMLHPDVLPYVLQDAIFPLIFCIGGIAACWGVMSRTNKQKMKLIQEMQREEQYH